MKAFVRALDDRWVALSLFLASFGLLLFTQRTAGFTRDESVYFAAGEQYARWFALLWQQPSVALRDSAIAPIFQMNWEHPALMKTMFGLSHALFHQRLGLFSSATAFRIPALITSAGIPAVVYLFGNRIYGRFAAFFAAATFFLAPRHLFNAELACFDMPIAFFWLSTMYCFWRAPESWRFGIATGAVFGLSLAVKHNALFIPLVIVPFALWQAFRSTADDAKARRYLFVFVAIHLTAAALYVLLWFALGAQRFEATFQLLSLQVAIYLCFVATSIGFLKALWNLHRRAAMCLLPVTAMAILGPAIFYLHWPYLWHAPVERVAAYLAFHAEHVHYAWFYLGKVLREPPFPLEYVFVKTALTLPATFVVAIVLGVALVVARCFKSDETTRFSDGLILANAAASILIISHPSVPHFGGVKHWLPSMPFLFLCAGFAVSVACDALTVDRARVWALRAVTSLLLALPAFIASYRIHPYGTSFYGELAGGLPGAASLGMQRQFWSSNVIGVLPWINAHAPSGARVWLHEVNAFSFYDYQRNGLLRPDLRRANGPFDSEIAAYQYHQEFREHEMNIWEAFQTTRHVAGLYLDETPQIVVYQRGPRDAD